MQRPDKRRHVRVVFTRTVKIIISERNIGNFSARNLSIGGLLADGDTGLVPGQACTLELHETGRNSSLLLTFTARVARSNSDQTAFEFTDMEDDSYMFLQTMVLYASDDPVGIAKEFLEDFRQLSPGEKSSDSFG